MRRACKVSRAARPKDRATVAFGALFSLLRLSLATNLLDRLLIVVAAPGVDGGEVGIARRKASAHSHAAQ